jgi:hypothetical protein
MIASPALTIDLTRDGPVTVGPTNLAIWPTAGPMYTGPLP